jgi:hypothetical protein
MREKKIVAKVVYQRIPAKQISDEDKKKPEIKEQLAKQGYVDVESVIRPEQLGVLESLLKLGYVKKRTSTFYKTWISKDVWLYEPRMGPLGSFSLSGPEKQSSSSFHLEQQEYERVVEGFKEIKEDMAKGLHPHVKDISMGVQYEYETDVYEVEDEFFDAAYLQVKDDKLRVWLTLPFIESGHDSMDSKNWERVGEADSTKFLSGKEAFLPEIRGLEWKKGAVGAIIFEGEGYFIAPGDKGPTATRSEPPRVLEELENDFGRIRLQDDLEALRGEFRIRALEGLTLIRDCNDSSRQTPKCAISPIFLPTSQAVAIAAGLPTKIPTSRVELGSLAEDLTKLLWEDSENGKRVAQVVLRDMESELWVIRQLRHHERHDREVGTPNAVQRKYFEVGSIYRAMIGSPIPASTVHWAQLGCCLLLVARQVLNQVLTSIRAIA